MSTDFSQFLRAVYKEFHVGGRYYKGKGREIRQRYGDSQTLKSRSASYTTRKNVHQTLTLSNRQPVAEDKDFHVKTA